MRWSVFFLLTAVVAALVGFGELINNFSGIAKVLFLVFISGFFIAFFNEGASDKNTRTRFSGKH